MYYAKLDENGIVENVIVATPDIIAEMDWVFVETDMENPSIRRAEIGDGWDGVEFLRKPVSVSVWDGVHWHTDPQIGIREDSPIIQADGVDFVTVYILGDIPSPQDVTINGEVVSVEIKSGYGEFEVSSETEGLITVGWQGLTLEIAAL